MILFAVPDPRHESILFYLLLITTSELLTLKLISAQPSTNALLVLWSPPSYQVMSLSVGWMDCYCVLNTWTVFHHTYYYIIIIRPPFPRHLLQSLQRISIRNMVVPWQNLSCFILPASSLFIAETPTTTPGTPQPHSLVYIWSSCCCFPGELLKLFVSSHPPLMKVFCSLGGIYRWYVVHLPYSRLLSLGSRATAEL